MTDPQLDPQLTPQLDPQTLQDWHDRIAEANRNNIFCHCKECDREWVASEPERCSCGSTYVEHIACWQFPDG